VNLQFPLQIAFLARPGATADPADNGQVPAALAIHALGTAVRWRITAASGTSEILKLTPSEPF